MIAKLVVIQGSTTIKEVTLRRPRTIAGRKKGCKLRITSELVSRIHCSFIRGDDRLSIKDLGSSNGTFVNGVRISEAPLKTGDTVQIGPVKFVVKILQDPVAGSVAAPPRQQVADDEVVFFEVDDAADQAPEEIIEADLLEDLEDEVEFVTEGEGQEAVPSNQNIFAVDEQKPLDVNQFLIPDDDEGGDYRVADPRDKKKKRRP
jgi:predicted component of type VI protein secretion system